MAGIFIVVTTGVLFVIIFWLLSRPRSNLPSPPGHPIIGNLLQFIRPRTFLWLTQWSSKLGPVFRVRLLHINIVVVNDYDTIYAVLVKQGKEFAGRQALFVKRVTYSTDNAGIVFSEPTDEWQFLRQSVHKKVKMYDKGLSVVESISMAAIEDMVREVTRHGGQTPFNPRSIIHNTTMNIVCVFLLGRTFSQNDPFFLLAIEVERELVEIVTPGSKGSELEVMWWLRHLGTKNFKRVERLAEKIIEFWGMARQMIEQDMTGTTHNEFGIMHDLLAGVRDKKSSVPKSLTEGHLKAAFVDLIVSGMSTTTSSFYSFLNIMTWYPEVQAKLRLEMDNVVGADRAVGFNDKLSMPYTRASIIELVRYTSNVPLGAPHATLVDTSINGYHIPKNTAVTTNLWALHHDEKFWGDPWEFRPERFLDDEGELLAAGHERRKHIMAFGAGPRVCLGESFALGRLFLLITTFIQRFEMLPGPTPVSCDARQCLPGGVLYTPEFELLFIPRQMTVRIP